MAMALTGWGWVLNRNCRLRRGCGNCGMKSLLIVVVQQHGDNRRFVFTFSETAAETNESPAAFGLEFVAGPEPRFEYGGQTLGNNLLDVRVGGRRAFLHVDTEASGDSNQLQLFHLIHQGHRNPGSTCPPRA